MKFKKIAVTVAVMVTGFFGAVAMASPTQASGLACPGETVCVYTGANYTGSTYSWSANPYKGQCVPMQGSFDQTMSSVIIHTIPGRVKFFNGTWCTGMNGGWNGGDYHIPSFSPGIDNWARSFLWAIQ
jgi:hypothetical protein